MTTKPDPADTPREALFSDFPPVPTEEWEARITRDLKGKDYEKALVWRPDRGLHVRPYYRQEDLEALDHLGTAPGQFPYVRGTDPSGDWAVRQDLSKPDPAEANRSARHALDRGAAALGFIVDADGFEGIRLERPDDVQRLLDDIPLDKTPVHFAGGPAALSALAMLLNEAERRGVSLTSLQGSVDYDPVGRFAQGQRLHLASSFDEAAAVLREVAAAAPQLRLLAVDGQVYDNAGASPVQTLAFSLAAASEYLAQLTERGVSVADVCARLHVVMPVGASYFLEIAKLRALRLLFARVVEAYDAGQAEQARAYVQAVTSRWNMTLYDPHMNLLRGTTEAAAAVLGGCNTLSVRPFDAAGAHPSDDFAYRLSRNTQLVLKHEAHLHEAADPAAGSYYIEQLTDQVARSAWSLFQEVEAQGGLAEALRAGFVQEQIQQERERYEAELATRRRVLVGTNQYPDVGELRLADASSAEISVKEAAPKSSVNGRTYDPARVLSVLRNAFGLGATLTEVLQAQEAYHTQQDGAEAAVPLPVRRGAEAFEALRLRTEQYAQIHDRTPSVFLMPLGNPAMRSARASFARNFFGCAGFGIHEAIGYKTVDAGVEAAVASGAEIVVVCSSDPEYAELVPAVVKQLQAAGSEALVVVAGYPQDQIETLRDAGAYGFVHLKANLLETLQEYQERLGIRSGDGT